MSTTPNNEKSDKAVPFTTSADAAKAGASTTAGSTTGNTSSSAAGSTTGSSSNVGSNSATNTNAADVVNRVAQSAHATIDRLANQAGPAVQHLQKSLEDTGERLHLRADQARDLSNEWCESLRTSVREHPLAAVGTALAIGLLIARLSR